MSNQQSPPQAVGVIGAGLGGLAAAATLAARGRRVILFERNNWLGGKAAVLAERGFRFDMGPTILTLPSVLTRIFAEAGRDLSDYLRLVPLDPQWRSFFEGGSTLDLFADPDEMAAVLADWSPRTGAAEGYRKLLALAERQHSVSERYFFWRSVGSAPDASPAVLCGIAHMQISEGIWYPQGGIQAVPRALTRLIEELGVERGALAAW